MKETWQRTAVISSIAAKPESATMMISQSGKIRRWLRSRLLLLWRGPLGPPGHFATPRLPDADGGGPLSRTIGWPSARIAAASSRSPSNPHAAAPLRADSDEAARLKRDDCAQGFLDDAAPCNEMITPGAPRLLAE
jgi:hypothetical protein